ncbi:MAG: molybdopterin-dependent oxidoreductase, partial [Oricola sp.]|nr:molybdopterin-dependent oxidoreductase [Oricola sp.]
MGKILRRTFLIGTGLVAGGLAVGYYAASRPWPNPLEADLAPGEETFNPYVKIGADGAITIIAPRAEMGQGVHTTLAALVAEELGVPLSAVAVDQGPTSPAYYNLAVLEQGGPFSELDTSLMAETARKATRAFGPLAGMQITGSSTSVRDAYDKMRQAGAVARTLLFAAAQERLATPASKLQFDGAEIVAPSGRRVGIASIAAEAAALPVPDEIVLKDPADWTLLGKTQQRVDLVDKVTGAAEFGIDVDLPDMLYGTVLMNPKLGGGIETASTSFAEAVPGV